MKKCVEFDQPDRGETSFLYLYLPRGGGGGAPRCGKGYQLRSDRCGVVAVMAIKKKKKKKRGGGGLKKKRGGGGCPLIILLSYVYIQICS